MWYVYVLRSVKNGRLYTGSTNDLDRRLAEHQRGKNRYTRHAGPFELLHTEQVETRLEARRRERALKRRAGARLYEGTDGPLELSWLEWSPKATGQWFESAGH